MRLVAAGHEVVGMTRSASKREAVRAMGATPVLADALVAEEVASAVGEAEPEVIVHELTAIPAVIDLRHFDRSFELTDRLRTEGTDHLLSAGRAVGVRRFVAQSNAGWPFAREGASVKGEGAARSAPGRVDGANVRGDPPRRARGRRRRLDDRRRAALRLPLRSGHVAAQGRRDRSVVNPDKLGHLGPVADVRAALGARERPYPNVNE